MKPIFLTLCALALGTAGCGHLTTKNTQPPAAADPSIAADPSKPNSPANSPEIVETNNIIAQVAAWKLGAVDIQNDLDGGVTVVRTRDIDPTAPTGRFDDRALTQLIKQRLEADPDVGRASIDIKATPSEVTLRGRAENAATIGRAIAIVLSTPGVTKVSSDIKADAPVSPANR